MGNTERDLSRVQWSRDKTRAFRDKEIVVLGPALSKALAQATPALCAYSHLSHAADQGEEVTNTEWLSVPGVILSLVTRGPCSA